MNIDDLKEHIKITVTQHDIDVAWIPGTHDTPIASIPAAIILVVFGFMLAGILSGFFG